MNKEELKEARRKVLRMLKTPESVIQLKEINEKLSGIFASKDIKEIVFNGESLNYLQKLIDKINEMTNLEIKTEKVYFPNKVKIDWQNMPRPQSITIPKKTKIDWEKAPKLKILKPLKWLSKSMESIFNNMFGKIVTYFKEPDRISWNNNQIVEYYGDRRVIYDLKIDDESIKGEITRHES